jgi:hypothetical protein
LLRFGFDPVWTGGAWTRLKVKSDDVRQLWPAAAATPGANRAAFTKTAALTTAVLEYAKEHNDDSPAPIRSAREAAIKEKYQEKHPEFKIASEVTWAAMWALDGVNPAWSRPGRRAKATVPGAN